MAHKDNTRMKALEGLMVSYHDMPFEGMPGEKKKKKKETKARVTEEYKIPIEQLSKYLEQKMKEKED